MITSCVEYEMTQEEREQIADAMMEMEIEDILKLKQYLLELKEINRLKKIEQAVNRRNGTKLTVLPGRLAN